MRRGHSVGIFYMNVVMNYPVVLANQVQYTNFKLFRSPICFTFLPELHIQGFTSSGLMHVKRREAVYIHTFILIHLLPPPAGRRCAPPPCSHTDLGLHYCDFWFPF